MYIFINTLFVYLKITSTELVMQSPLKLIYSLKRPPLDVQSQEMCC